MSQHLFIQINSLNRLVVGFCESSDDGVPHIEGAARRADEEFVGVSSGGRGGEGGDEVGGCERVGEGGRDGEVGLDLLEVGDAQILAAAIQEGQSSLACFQIDRSNVCGRPFVLIFVARVFMHGSNKIADSYKKKAWL
ncbi:hypothetical protein AKJ16_DCAP24761 [Drosera capensis]